MKKMIKEVMINGEICHLLEIENQFLKFSCLDFGATITNLSTNDKFGNSRNVVLAYNDYNDYYHNSPFLGALVAPLPGRIKNHQVEINGVVYSLEANDGNNCLHGGKNTLAFKKFDYEVLEDRIILKTLIKDLEVGIPGNIELIVTYLLVDNKLEMIYEYKSDQDTVFGVTNHTYFNLDGKDLSTHKLQINANYFVRLDEDYVPNMPAKVNDIHDFFEEKLLDDLDSEEIDSFEKAKGLDHPYILFDGENAISLKSEDSGILMNVSTDEEAVVVYTGNYLPSEIKYRDLNYQKHLGIALECQNIPNAMNSKISDSWFLKKGVRVSKKTVIELGLIND